MKVLVTGSSGFIGRSVIEWLTKSDHDYLPFDLEEGRDIRSYPQVLAAVSKVDAVIHLAGLLGTHELFACPRLALDTNVGGTLNVLEASRYHQKQYVTITMPYVFPSVYTACKVAAFAFEKAYHYTHKMRVSRVRAWNAYGEGQAHGEDYPQKIIPTFATLAWQGKPLPVWGDGQQTVDLVHVDDVGRMLVEALGYTGGETFDAGTGTPMTVLQVAHMVNDITGNKAGVEHLPMRKGEIPVRLAAGGEGWNTLGWKPTFDPQSFAAAVYSYKEPLT